MWRYSRGRGGVLTGKPLSRIIPLLESSGSEFPSTQLDKYTKVRRTTFKWGCGTAATAADCKSAPSGFPGSSPGTPTIFARVAQSVEHIVGNDEVTGSSPVAGSSRNSQPRCLRRRWQGDESGGVAQLVRAHGSYPWRHWFESSHRYQFFQPCKGLFSISTKFA